MKREIVEVLKNINEKVDKWPGVRAALKEMNFPLGKEREFSSVYEIKKEKRGEDKKKKTG